MEGRRDPREGGQVSAPDESVVVYRSNEQHDGFYDLCVFTTSRAEADDVEYRALRVAAYDALLAPLPVLAIPRAIPSDPSVFTQLGPLPHARIETSLCLAALLHRCAQWTIAQIEEGGSLEDQQAQAGEPVGETVASPFDSPLPPMPAKPPKAWRNKKRRWK